MSRRWWLVGVVVSFAACGGGRLPPLRVAPAATSLQASPSTLFFRIGEQMKWDVTLRGLRSGSADLRVLESTSDASVWELLSEARTGGFWGIFKHMRETDSTALSVPTAAPLHSHAESQSGDKWVRIDTRFLSSQHEIRLQKSGQPEQQGLRASPPGRVLHTVQSALGVFRGWNAPFGKPGEFFALSGTRLYRVEFVASAEEMVDTALGKVKARRIDGNAFRLNDAQQPDPAKKPMRFAIWVAMTAARVPVRLRADTSFGSMQADIASYTAAGASVAAR